MNKKICKIHGQLTHEQIKIEKTSYGFTKRCRFCIKDGQIRRAKERIEKGYICKIHGELTKNLIYTRNGKCKLCFRKSANRKRNENRAWFNAKVAKDKINNPEKWKFIHRKIYEYQKNKWGQLYSLKKVCDARGITLEQFQKMYDHQKGVCAICGQEETRINGRTKKIGRLIIDHCHKTNIVRGLLCHNCNTGIGKFFDDISRIIRAARYIKQKGWTPS